MSVRSSTEHSAAPAPSATTDVSLARKVLETEAAAILALVERLDQRFERAVRILLECRGRVIVTGMGSGGSSEKVSDPG